MKQCTELNIPFVDSPESGLHDSDLIVDAIFGKLQALLVRGHSRVCVLYFAYDTVDKCLQSLLYFTGFSFSGEVRQPFVSAIQALKNTTIPIVSGNYQIAPFATSHPGRCVNVNQFSF